MGFFDLNGLIQAGIDGLTGIAVVEENVDRVIVQIEAEQENLRPVAFAFGALIHAPAFGGADSAPGLSMHYSKAHEVTWKTLKGVKQDLLDFQQALRDAKNEIIKADESSADRVRLVTNAIETVAAGSYGGHGDRAHENAQRDAATVGSAD